jgi:hypothetical protein
MIVFYAVCIRNETTGGGGKSDYLEVDFAALAVCNISFVEDLK